MDNEIDRSISYLHDYSRQHPSQYEGENDGLKFEEWLLQIEKILDALRIPNDSERVRLASFFLIDSAYMWWITVRSIRSVELMTWDNFISLFLERHFFDTDWKAY